MKLKYNFETITMGDEIVAVPVGEEARRVHGVLKLNKEGQEIFTLLAKETTVEKIVDILSSSYENEKANLTVYVESIISKLRELDLIEE